MSNQFDELAKSMAQSVTRRAALKKFGVGLAGMVLACFGLPQRTQADSNHFCQSTKDCAVWGASYVCCQSFTGVKACVPNKSNCSHGKIIWV